MFNLIYYKEKGGRMGLKVVVPSALVERPRGLFRRATLWLDDNRDWWWIPVAVAIAFFVLVLFLGYYPRPTEWTRVR